MPPQERYPDISRLVIPFRHLLLQGLVPAPKTAHDAPLDYASEEALLAAFEALVEEMRTAKGAAAVVGRLRPFCGRAQGYYYAYEEARGEQWGRGVEAYASYILGPLGVGRGWEGAFSQIALVMKEAVEVEWSGALLQRRGRGGSQARAHQDQRPVHQEGCVVA